MLNVIDRQLLEKIVNLNYLSDGAYNIRKNAQEIGRNSTANISIAAKKDKPGIDVIVKPETKGENVHIFTIMSQAADDLVYNTFEIGASSQVLIIAGCAINNPNVINSRHNVTNRFIVQENARLKYVEKHYVDGESPCQRTLNQKTALEAEKNAIAEFELIQLNGGAQTVRQTEAYLHKNASLTILERLGTYSNQLSESNIAIALAQEGATAQVTSRSVAQNNSRQVFHFNMRGYAKCRGQIECDSIILDEAEVSYIPKISSFDTEAQLIQNTAIGKICSEQLIKLMCWGLTEEQAKNVILQGFLN